MMQGDACYLAIRILNNVGNYVSPAEVREVEITIGHLRKTYQNKEVLFQDGKWLFPLSQEETRAFWPTEIKAQVRVLWNNGIVEGKPLYGVRIQESISKEVL